MFIKHTLIKKYEYKNGVYILKENGTKIDKHINFNSENNIPIDYNESIFN